MDDSKAKVMVKMEDCLDRANQLRQEGKWDEAIAVYQRVLKLDPNSYQSYHYIGETLAQKGELEAAAKFYNLARETNPLSSWQGCFIIKKTKINQS